MLPEPKRDVTANSNSASFFIVASHQWNLNAIGRIKFPWRPFALVGQLNSTTTSVPATPSLLTAESCSPGPTLTISVQLSGSKAPLLVEAVTDFPIRYRTPPVEVNAPGAVNEIQ